MKSIKIKTPKGYVIDEENSTFTEIKFKKIDDRLYQILSVYGNPNCGNSTTIYTVKDETILVHSDGREYPQKNLDIFPIHSVKRLSDGEIFTLGDYIQYGKITRFSMNSTNEYFGVNTDNNNQIWTNITCITKSKTPLFISEDGMKIYKGDTIYYVETTDEPPHNYIPYKLTVQNSGRFTSDSTVFAFSTQENAEDWIISNKPCLTYNDLLPLWDKNRNKSKSFFFTELRKLIKNKL